MTDTGKKAVEKEFTKEYVKYFFTEEERRDLATELAQKVSDQQIAEDEKKAIMSDLKSKIDSLAAQSNSLATRLNSGYEMRHIKCEVIKDFKNGRVQHMRTDTGEIVRDRKMTDEDRQLKVV
jgi:hypothetical protein